MQLPDDSNVAGDNKVADLNGTRCRPDGTIGLRKRWFLG